MIINNLDIGAKLRRNFLLPIFWKYVNWSNVLTYYQKLKEYQWNSLKENGEIQRIKLFKLITYASQNIPCYQQVIKEHNIQFSENTIFEDIKKFPLLTKEIIKNHFSKLHRFSGKIYYCNILGGSPESWLSSIRIRNICPGPMPPNAYLMNGQAGGWMTPW